MQERIADDTHCRTLLNTCSHISNNRRQTEFGTLVSNSSLSLHVILLKQIPLTLSLGYKATTAIIQLRTLQATECEMEKCRQLNKG